MLVGIKGLARQVRKRLSSPSALRKFDLSSVPEPYQPLVRRIMANSPIWGAHQTIDFPNGFVLKGGRDQSRIGQFNLPAISGAVPSWTSAAILVASRWSARSGTLTGWSAWT